MKQQGRRTDHYEGLKEKGKSGLWNSGDRKLLELSVENDYEGESGMKGVHCALVVNAKSQMTSAHLQGSDADTASYIMSMSTLTEFPHL